MNFTSVSGKKWIFKKFVDADIKQFSDDFSYESECHLCIIEIAEENQSFTIQNKVFEISIDIGYLNEDFVLITPNSYYSRAPPKI